MNNYSLMRRDSILDNTTIIKLLFFYSDIRVSCVHQIVHLFYSNVRVSCVHQIVHFFNTVLLWIIMFAPRAYFRSHFLNTVLLRIIMLSSHAYFISHFLNTLLLQIINDPGSVSRLWHITLSHFTRYKSWGSYQKNVCLWCT